MVIVFIHINRIMKLVTTFYPQWLLWTGKIQIINMGTPQFPPTKETRMNRNIRGWNQPRWGSNGDWISHTEVFQFKNPLGSPKWNCLLRVHFWHQILTRLWGTLMFSLGMLECRKYFYQPPTNPRGSKSAGENLNWAAWPLLFMLCQPLRQRKWIYRGRHLPPCPLSAICWEYSKGTLGVDIRTTLGFTYRSFVDVVGHSGQHVGECPTARGPLN